MTKLTCRACADFLVDYLSGEMDQDLRATFEVHLDKCTNCRAYLEQYASVITTSQGACARENDDAAASFPDELVAAILQARANQR